MSFPPGSYLFQLKDDSKEPAVPRAHLMAVPDDQFVQVGQNVGIALKVKGVTQFICADLDRPNAELEAKLTAEGTWSQATPHARHWLFLPPPGFRGSNSKLPMGSGDLKSDGYIVAPGSHVVCDGSRHADGRACGKTDYVHDGPDELKPAPPWLLDLFVKHDAKNPVEETSGIAKGNHDNFLFGVARYVRQEWGLSEAAVQKMLVKGPRTVLEGENPNDPYTESSMRRIAHSAASKAPLEPTVKLSPAGVTSAFEIPMVGEPIRWWVFGFVPRGRYIGLYGPGGAGKTTWGAWLAAQVTQKAPFLYVGVEEDGTEFVPKARLAGAVAANLYSLDDPMTYTFPRDAGRLEEMIAAMGVGVVYFDSIYNHFSADEGLMVSERTRKILSSLDLVARKTKCTIIGVFHVKRDGTFSGSEEMRSVPRVLLRARRLKDRPLRIRVEKSNLDNTGTVMQFGVRSVPLADVDTGEVQLVEDAGGVLRPYDIRVAERIVDISEEDADVDESVFPETHP